MSWPLTTDLSVGFFLKHDAVCKDLGAAPLDSLLVQNAESGVRAAAQNPVTNASGLIQFMPSILKGLGWTKSPEDFRALTAVDQLPYVFRYFNAHRGKLTTAQRIYVAVFLPALIDDATSDDYVLSARGGKLGWAYAANAVFDSNRDYVITLGELGEAIRRNARGKRWEEIYWRATGSGPSLVELADYGLRTTMGIQQALARLGFNPGPLDGFAGPSTTHALLSFQVAKGITADGIPGPVTRDALRLALAASP